MDIFKIAETEEGLGEADIRAALEASIAGRTLRKVLIIPPDFTRFHSNAGFITQVYHALLTAQGAQVDIMPALGTHVPVSESQWKTMFGDIPYEKMLVHNWRTDVVRLGEVPAAEVERLSEGLWKDPVSVEVNRRLMDEKLAAQSLEVRPVLETARADLICGLVVQDMGISFLPDYVTEEETESGNLIRLNVPDFQIVVWKQLIYRRDKWLSPQMKAMISYLSDILLYKK